MTFTAAELNLAFAREVAGLDPDQDCLYGNGRRIYENWREIIDHKGREVIDHEGVPACACGWTGKSWHNTGHKKALPDYTKDWNAVIFEIHKRGLEWEKNHSSWLPEVGAKKIRVGTFQVRRIPKEKEPSGFWWYAVDQEPNWEPCHALCLAAVRCVRAMRVAERKYNDRENPE